MDAFSEHGPVWILVGSLIMGGFTALRWLANHIALPAGKAFIEYLSQQSAVASENQQTARETREATYKLVEMEKEIRRAIQEMHKQSNEDSRLMLEAHSDPLSMFCTLQTNDALVILARAVERVARALDIEVNDLVEEIERLMESQKRESLVK